MVRFIITDPNISKLQDKEIPFGVNICEVIKVSSEEIRNENFFGNDYNDFDYFIMQEKKMELKEAMNYRKKLNESQRLKDIDIARCMIGMKKVLYKIIDEALFNKREKHSIMLDLTETPRVNIIGIIKFLATSLDFVNREIEIYLCVSENNYNNIEAKQIELDTWTDKLKSEGISIERVEFERAM